MSDQQPAPDPLASAEASYDPMPLEVSDRESRNWMGITALITGIIGFSAAAIVFGILGLTAVKNGKATNGAMNRWGIILGGAWLVISVVASVAFLNYLTDAAAQRDSGAEPGDCYVSTIETADDFATFVPEFGDCTDETNAEVFYITTYKGAAVPSDPDFYVDDLPEVCMSAEATEHLPLDALQSGDDLGLEVYAPHAGDWNSAPHTVVCSVATKSD